MRRRPGGWRRSPTCTSIARPRHVPWIVTRRNSLTCCRCRRGLSTTSEVVYRTVDAEGFVVYRNNFYATPWRLIGQPVAVRTTEDELVIHDRAFVEAARHRLFPRTVTGQRSLCNDHEPPRDSQHRPEQLTERFAEFGPSAVASWRACWPAPATARARRNVFSR